MDNSPATTGDFNAWTPDEMGLPKATAFALILVGLIVVFCVLASTVLAPKPPPAAIQVTQAQLVQLPTPTPPPPPKVIPPPKPLPAIIPKPLPVPSKIVVATKPPPVHHLYKPIQHPVVTHQPPPPTPVQQPAPPQAAVQPTSGEPIYGSEMHSILEANQNVPPALAQLGISGTALVEVTMAPNGHVVSARIVQSGGNPLIDSTALDHVMHASFPPFNAEMPNTVLKFDIPVDIEPQSND